MTTDSDALRLTVSPQSPADSESEALSSALAPQLPADPESEAPGLTATPQLPVDSESEAPRSKLMLCAVGLGAFAYCAYVGIGLLLGLVFISMSTPSASATSPTIQLPLPPNLLSLPPFSIPGVVDPLSLFPTWRGTERINVLLMGVDQRDDEREWGIPPRTDTMIVLSIDPVLKSAAMISFPRDLWVRIPGYGEDRINVAYRFGELNQTRVEGGGPGVAARTIEQNFGLRVPYYATVDFRGFEDVVNTVGGLVIDVRRPIKDDEYPTKDYGFERVYFAPGPQVMDGPLALKYARTRHADSDFGRMARQQQVLLALRDRALRLNMLPRLPTLLDQGTRSVQTNLSTTELLSLARLTSEIENAAVGTLVIDNQLVTSAPGVAAILVPKRDAIRTAIAKALADPRLLREAGRVEIVSSPARAQLARQIADHLAGQGLQNVRQTTSTQPEAEATSVYLFADKPRSLDALVRALNLSEQNVLAGAPEESQSDIRLVLGRDFQLNP